MTYKVTEYEENGESMIKFKPDCQCRRDDEKEAKENPNRIMVPKCTHTYISFNKDLFLSVKNYLDTLQKN